MRSFRYALVLALAGSAVALGSAALAADPTGTVTFAGAGGGHRVREISLSPGRVTFAQRGGTPRGTPILKRSVDVTGSTVVLGTAATLGLAEPKSGGGFIAGDAFDGLVPGSASGSRTLWGTEVWADTYEGGYSLDAEYGARLSQGTTKLRAFASPSGPLRLSGTRALYYSQSGYKLYDLKTGTAKLVKDLIGKTLWSAPEYGRGTPADLFGDYVAFVAADGSVWRKNITGSNSAVQLSPAPDPDTGYVHDTQVFAFGDWVGWRRDLWKFGALADVDCGLRNAATMAPAVSLSVCPEQLTTGGVLGQDEGTKVWSLRHYDGSSVDLPVPNDAQQVVLDGHVLAWIQADSVGRIAPYDAPVAAPRSLGNPIAATTYQRGGHTWSFDLVASAALKTCTVTIKKQYSKTVRVLPCTTGLLKAGEIAARWDGKNGSGTTVPAGTYLWIVTAANDVDDLVPGDGAPGQESGKIKVS